MTNAAAISRYRAVQVTTCTPGQLLVMLYDGLLRYLNEAKTAMTARNRARAGERISRAHAILENLLVNLNREVSPALVDQLEPLYAFCMTHLVKANLKQDPDAIGDVIRMLTPLRDAWSDAVKQLATASR